MRASKCLTALLAAWAAVASAATPIEAQLEFATRKDSRGYQPRGYRGLSLRAQARSQAGLPKLNSQRPLFVDGLTLRGNKVRAVLDQTNKAAGFYNVLYIDTDGDGDLSDETPKTVDLQKRGRYLKVRFEDVELSLPTDQGGAPYAMSLDVRCYKPKDFESAPDAEAIVKQRMVRCYMESACRYQGAIEHLGKTYRIILGDTDGDGDFGPGVSASLRRQSDGKSYYWRGGAVWMAEDHAPNYADRLPLGEVLCLAQTPFRVAFEPVGGKLTLTPVGGGLGRVDFDGLAGDDLVNVLLYCKDGKTAVSAFQVAGSATVPPGEYRLGFYTCLRTEPRGAKWYLSASGTPDAAPVRVAAAARAALRLGEPFQTSLSVRTQSFAPAATPLNLSIRGAAGENVDNLRLVEGKSDFTEGRSSRPPAPAYEVRDASTGKVVVQGSLRYG